MFLPKYLVWHYSYALKNIWGIWTNYLWFSYNLFSIKILTKTVFAPWKKLGEDYKEGFNVTDFFATFFINSMMRMVGGLIRVSVIALGLIVILVVLFFGLLFFVIWLFMPAILLLCLFIGLGYLFKYDI